MSYSDRELAVMARILRALEDIPTKKRRYEVSSYITSRMIHEMMQIDDAVRPTLFRSRI